MFSWRKRRQVRVHIVAPWGPHCYLKQGRHEKPFAKLRTKGKERRQERRFKLQQREQLLAGVCEWSS